RRDYRHAASLSHPAPAMELQRTGGCHAHERRIRDQRRPCGAKPIATRGLNRNYNRRMKEVFIGAATGGSQTEPYRSYLEALEHRGIRQEMARLTLARKIAAVALRIWKKGEAFDPKKLNWTT